MAYGWHRDGIEIGTKMAGTKIAYNGVLGRGLPFDLLLQPVHEPEHQP